MNDDVLARWADAERVLDEVIDLPPEARTDRVQALCGADAPLRKAVERLLSAEATDVSRLAATPVVEEALRADPTPDLPTHVGPFRILGELGRGGMGRVLLAEPEGSGPQPRVALKVLDRPMHTAGAARRFERERETLARLAHPHIARLHDGGVTDEGTPYLVMELVEGLPVDQHCDTHRLDIDARLGLFRQICQAVEFAHSRLVVHRDLKPANVLVDAHGQVKLLDFGIAKWLDDLDADSPMTLTSHRVLTPAYAAPEQFLGEAITAGTDVYQLGLLLYLLLTGQRAHAVDGATPDAVRHAVCDTEPTRPSACVTEPEVTAAALPVGDSAHTRATTIRGLARRLAGDLDAIVLKALRKDPRDRYATVEALRRDLDSHLAHRPVSARQGTRIYAMRKYVRRHPAPLATAAGVLIASTVGLVAVSSQARVTATERDRAVAAERSAAAVNSFLVDELLTAPTPERAGGSAAGRALTVVEVLGNASRSVGVALESAPAVQARVRDTLARSYLALGLNDEAKTHANEAYRLASQLASADDPLVLAARRLRVDVALADGKGQGLKAEMAAVLAAYQRALGPAHSETLLAHATFGRTLDRLDERAAAEATLKEADTMAAATPAASPEARTAVRSAYVEVLLANHKARAAEPLVREQIDWLHQRYGPTHPQLVPAGRLYARVLSETLETERAVTASEEQVRLHEQLYGADHPATAQAVIDLAVAYDRAAHDDQALAAAQRALAIYQRTLGPDHSTTMKALRNVAISLRKGGHAVEALPMYRQVADTYRRTLGELHPRAIASLDEMGNALMDLDRVADARQLRRTVAALYERAAAAPDADPMIVDEYANFLIDAEPEDLRQSAKAVELATRAVDATKRADFDFLRTLARTLDANGQKAKALAVAKEASATPNGIQSFVTEMLIVRLMTELEPSQLEGWLLERLERLRRERGPDEYLQVRSLEHLARHYVRLGRPADAETRIREELDVLKRSVPATHFMVPLTQSALGERLMERGALAEAEPLLVAGFEGMLTSRRPTDSTKATARARLVRLYELMNRPADARKWREFVIPSFSDR